MTENTKPSSRTLDALVAERVMGFKWFAPPWKSRVVGGRILLRTPWHSDWPEWDGNPAVEPFYDCYREVPLYSRDIAAAMLLLPELDKITCDFALERSGSQWHAQAGGFPGATVPFDSPDDVLIAACKAICFAALRAVGVPEAEIQAALAPKEGAEK